MANIFYYIISVFSPSWDGDGCEGNVILYEGTDRSRAIEAWRQACSDIGPNCEIIVLGRENEHFDRKEARMKDFEEEEENEGLVTWVFQDDFMVFGEPGDLNDYCLYILSEALGHGDMESIMPYRASGSEYIYDVIVDWERSTP